MIRTTLLSQESFLLTEEPDWNTPIKGDFTLMTSTNESSTRRQERVAYSNTIRTTLSWTSYQDYTTVATLRSLLHSLGLNSSGAYTAFQPILCPFWPAMTYYGQPAPNYSSFYSIIWEPQFTSWSIFITANGIGSYTSTPQSMVAPLLIGTFDKLPKVMGQTGEDATVQFQFLENGPAAYALQVSGAVYQGPAWQTGPAWPVWYYLPQHPGVEAGDVDVTIARKQLGYTRDEGQTIYPQTPNRIVKADYIVDDGSNLLSLWSLSLADVYPIWLPAAFSPCRLTADLTSGAVLTVDNAAALDGQAHLFLNDGPGWAAQEILTTVGNTITLANAPGVFLAATAYVQPLLFAHFKGPSITISWTAPDIATCKLEFEELPPEYGSPSGETFGTTIGPLGLVNYLYTFTDSISTWYYTSAEANIVYQGNTYVSQHMSHGTITERINLADSTTDITFRNFSPNPFSKYRSSRLQMAMTGTILQLNTANAGYLVDSSGRYLVDSAGRYIATAPNVTASVIFTGRMKVPKFKAADIIIEFGGPTSIFDQMLPRPLVQLQCNTQLFTPQCGLSQANWTFTGTMPTPPSPGAPFQYTITSLTWPQGALPSIGAHYFAYGYIIRTLSDGSQQGMLIVDSTAYASGSMLLTLQGDCSPFPTGSETWSIVPNCAGRYVEDCGTTFNNQANFRGFPFMPMTDPSIFPPVQTTQTSKK